MTENELGLQKLQEVLMAYSCKLWWKWRTKSGIWSIYANNVSWQMSIALRHLTTVNAFMRRHTYVIIGDGSSSFLFDNPFGSSYLVDIFQLRNVEDLRVIQLQDIY